MWRPSLFRLAVLGFVEPDDICQKVLMEVRHPARSAFILGSINLRSESKNERFIPPVLRRRTQTFMSLNHWTQESQPSRRQHFTGFKTPNLPFTVGSSVSSSILVWTSGCPHTIGPVRTSAHMWAGRREAPPPGPHRGSSQG